MKVTPKTTLNSKVVQVMKNLQAFYNDYVRIFVGQAAQKGEKLIFY